MNKRVREEVMRNGWCAGRRQKCRRGKGLSNSEPCIVITIVKKNNINN